MYLGTYQHYKGNRYEIIAEALDSDTGEEMVVYKPLYKTDVIREDMFFVRAKKIFTENIMVGGNLVPRFKFIGKVE